MHPSRFDQLSRKFARRGSRRGLVASSLGLASAAVSSRTLAQEATPEDLPADPHPTVDEATVETEFLFVQPFESGTWEPRLGEDGMYTLTLSGADAHTVYFSDRPARIVGLAPTQQFLDGLGFPPENPPNAAIVAQRPAGGEQEVLVIELLDPVYDADAGTLTYDARVLADYGDPGLAHLAQGQTDYELSETFASGSLFIDACSHRTYGCYLNNTEVGTTRVRYCFDDLSLSCKPCHNPEKDCADAFPDQCKDANGNWLCAAER